MIDRAGAAIELRAVSDNVIAPVLPYKTAFDKRERARSLLAAVGLANPGRSLPARMSGGAQQCVVIRRVSQLG